MPAKVTEIPKMEEEKVQLPTEKTEEFQDTAEREDADAKESKGTRVPESEEAIVAEDFKTRDSEEVENLPKENVVAAEEEDNVEESKQHHLEEENVAEERTKSPPPSQEEQPCSPPSL